MCLYAEHAQERVLQDAHCQHVVGGSKMPRYTFDRRQFSRPELSIESIQQELAMAGQIQRSLFPTSSQLLNGYEIAGHSIACIEIGGDYYDFLHQSDFLHDTVKIVVGDVSGHGIDAALVVSSARAFIHARSTIAERPKDLISLMNRHLWLDNSHTGHFMTLFCLEVDLDTGNASWVRAGHDPAVVFTPEKGHFHELKGEGLPIGVDYHYSYSAYSLPKPPAGAVIAVGTDGIWNAGNDKGEFFGKDRFREIIRQTAMLSAEEIVQAVFHELGIFCTNVPLDDDVTLVVIKVP